MTLSILWTLRPLWFLPLPSPPPSRAHGTSAPIPGRAAGITLSILMGKTHLLRKGAPQSSRQLNPGTPEHMPCSIQVAGSQPHWVPRAHSDWQSQGVPSIWGDGWNSGTCQLFVSSCTAPPPPSHPPSPSGSIYRKGKESKGGRKVGRGAHLA